MEVAAQHGQLGVLVYIHNLGVVDSGFALEKAVFCNQPIEIFDFLQENTISRCTLQVSQ